MTSVTLIDGSKVSTSSPEWRDECLARHVLALPNLTQRRAWLADFEKRHGVEITDALKHGMQAAHKCK